MAQNNASVMTAQLPSKALPPVPQVAGAITTVSAPQAIGTGGSAIALPSPPIPATPATLAAMPLNSLSKSTPAALPANDTADDEEGSDADDDKNDSKVVAAPAVGAGRSYDTAMPMAQTVLYAQPAAHHIVAYLDTNDAYTIRQQFEFYKAALTCAPMYFAPNGVYIVRGNGDDTLVCTTEIFGLKLIQYTVDQERWSNPKGGYHAINVNLTDFHQQIKSTAKKEGLRIIQYAEHPEMVFLQQYGGDKNSDGGYLNVRTEPFQELRYDLNDGVRKGDKPNINVSLKSFCQTCTTLSRVKYSEALLHVYPNGAHLVSGNEIGSSGRTARWGECTGLMPSTNGIVIRGKTKQVAKYTTKIPLKVIKALMKLTNINTGGVVSIFCRSDGLVRLSISIGAASGECTIFLQEPVAKTA